MDKNTFEEIDKYIGNLFALEDEALTSTVQLLNATIMPKGSISLTQGKFLQLMATICNAKKILELGTLGGYSTIWLARALPKDGKLISIEMTPQNANLAKQNIHRAGLEDKVEIRVGTALEHLEKLVLDNEKPFDLVFFDVDEPSYTEYFKLVLKLSRKGTLIIADNVIIEGKVLDKNTVDERVLGAQRFNLFLSGCKEVSSTILLTGGVKKLDGMALAVVL